MCGQVRYIFAGKRVKDASEEEEERYTDILLVMELLTNLLSKDFVDFGEPGTYSVSKTSFSYRGVKHLYVTEKTTVRKPNKIDKTQPAYKYPRNIHIIR